MRSFRTFAALLLVSVFLAACEDPEGIDGMAAEEPRLVLTVPVQPLEAAYPALAGVVAPRMSSQLGFPMLGRLMSREVSVGDRVDAGDLLATVDATGLVSAVESARADLRAAQAQLENAAGAHERQSVLSRTGTTSQAMLEASELQLKTARTRVESATANLAQAQDQLDNARLVAGFESVVIAVSAEVGQVVAPGSPVITLARPDQHDVVVDVPERLVARLEPGSGFSIALELDSDLRVKGRVSEIAPEADSATRLHRIRIALENPPAVFRFGTTVLVRPDVPRDNVLFAIPASALLQSGSDASVWVVDPQTAAVSQRKVIAVERENGFVIVSQGLDAGELVVTAGVRSLEQGQVVRLDRENGS